MHIKVALDILAIETEKWLRMNMLWYIRMAMAAFITCGFCGVIDFCTCWFCGVAGVHVGFVVFKLLFACCSGVCNVDVIHHLVVLIWALVLGIGGL